MKKLILFVCILFPVTFLHAQQKFTYDDIQNGMFAQRTVSGVRSMNDGESYTVKDGNAIVRYSYRTGQMIDTVFFKGNGFAFTEYRFSRDERKILLSAQVESIYRRSFKAEYYIYDLGTGVLNPLSVHGKQQAADFSPDGTKVAFVRDNNLFYVDLGKGVEYQVTRDGMFNEVINGVPDWVYEEEFGLSKAYEWSPEGDAIAFCRFDEKHVKEYHMTIFEGQLYPSVYSFKYPKAGEQNSFVTVHCYHLGSAKTTVMDTGTETDQYIPRIKWSARKGKLVVFRLNRLQNTFEMLLADASDGQSDVFYTEKNARYVERVTDETVTFLPDGDRFIVKSEKDGFMHLYLYSIEKGELNRITGGPWEVTDFLGVDHENAAVYYLSTETSPLRRNLYSVGLDGTGKKRLTLLEGTYSVIFSNGMKYFLSYFSNASTPLAVTLHSKDGTLIRVLEENSRLKETIKKIGIPLKEFFAFTTSEGIELNGYLKKPAGFDAAKKYPVLMTQYSGPGSQSVADRWAVSWEDALVQEGYIVACVDGRGTGYRGEEFKKSTYLQLGRLETIDQIEAAKYLARQPYVDASRIGIYGWSYGGFMALNCILKGNDVFRTALAVAPVTNWRFYDTIYTELYNGLPQDNPSGYDDNSPIFFADWLKGNLFIAHGTADDNVHIQNSYEMISRLVDHGKTAEMFIYPDKNHSMYPGASRHHIYHVMIDFVKRKL